MFTSAERHLHLFSTHQQMEALFKCACAEIDDNVDDLKRLSDAIWENPELNFQETKCHDILTDFLEKKGFRVKRNYVLDTAFRAEWGDEGSAGPHIMVICEYDALPEIGHACGHNLIAEAGAAAGLGVKAAMEGHVGMGKITILGTPAEEGGGGKVFLIDGGAMEGVDAALMVHPAFFNNATPLMLAIKEVTVTYHGRAAHASAAPWEGVNALDAAVAAYTGVSHMRQQMRPSARVHGIITKGGTAANIIPHVTSLEFILREVTSRDLDLLVTKVEGIFRAVAESTGCTVTLEWGGQPYHNMVNNTTMAAMYERHILGLQGDWREHVGGKDFKGSTDFGNISHLVPSIHPMYYIGPEVNHTEDFTIRAKSEAAHQFTVNQGKAVAMTCLELMSQGELLTKVKDEFKGNHSM